MALLVAFLLLQALDIASTLLFMSAGASESNPLVADAMRRWGDAGLILVKLVMAGALVGLHAYMAPRDPARLRQVMLAAIIFYVLVVANNIVAALAVGASALVGLALFLMMTGTVAWTARHTA